MVMFGNVKLKLEVLSSKFDPAPLGSRLRAVFKALLQQSLHPPLFRTVFAEPWNVKRPFQGKKGFYELTSSRFNRRNVPRQAGPDLSWGPMAGRLFCCWCVEGVFWNLQLPFHHQQYFELQKKKEFSILCVLYQRPNDRKACGLKSRSDR